MQFATIIAAVVVCLLLSVFGVDCAKKKIIKEVNICKRNDPQIRKCYCDNFNRMIPVIKNGVPEMNIMPIDPVRVEHISMKLPETQATQFRADLSNVILRGLSLGRTMECNGHMTEDGIQLAFELVFPEVDMQSEYKGSGKFLLLALHGHGKFHGKFTGMDVKTVWNSTRFVKNGKEHLKFTTEIVDIKMKNIQVHFSNLLGNATEISDGINEVINANIDLLYDEIKPVVLQTIKELSLKLVNGLYETFAFDVLYPKN